MPDTTIYAEELHNTEPLTSENIWYIDPISATAAYVEGNPRYAITMAHEVEGKVCFACVHAPALGFLVYSIDQKIVVLHEGSFVSEYQQVPPQGYLYLRSKHWKHEEYADAVDLALQGIETFSKGGSVALAELACVIGVGFQGGIVLGKDIFPHKAAQGIIEAMGGKTVFAEFHKKVPAEDILFVFGRTEEEYEYCLAKIASL